MSSTRWYTISNCHLFNLSSRHNLPRCSNFNNHRQAVARYRRSLASYCVGLFVVACFLLPLLNLSVLSAQEITTSPVIKFLGSTIQATTHLSPIGQSSAIALDAKGNIYYSEGGQGSVIRMPIAGGPKATVLSGISGINAIAVDSGGDVFVTSSALDHVVEFQASSGETLSLGYGLAAPKSVSVMAQGTVVVADTGNNRIVSILPSGVMSVLHSGVDAPSAIYADPAGDLYVGSPSGIVAFWTNGQVYKQGQQFSLPSSITQAGSANLYVVDQGTHQLIETNAAGGQQRVVLGPGDGVVVSSVIGSTNGDLYAFDQQNGQIIKLDSQIAMGASAVGSGTQPHTLTLEFTSRVSLGGILAVTQGLNDGQLVVSGGTCLVNFVYLSGDTCTINTSAVMSHAGPWNGNLTLTDGQGNDLLDFECFGTAIAPVRALLPGTAQTFYRNPYSYTGELIPSALAVDSADNVYIGDDANRRVLKVSSTGSSRVLLDGSSSTGGGLQDPLAIALDGKGNVFVADQSLAFGISPNLGSPSSLQPNLFPAIPYGQWGYSRSFVAFMTGLVVQPDGGFVFSDSGNNRVVAVDPTGVGVELVTNADPVGPRQQTIGYPMNLAYALDGSLLILDYDNNRVISRSKAGKLSEVFSDGTPLAGQSIIAPMGLAVDPAGDLYISDTGNNRIVGLTPQGYSWIILDANSLIDGSNDLPLNNPQAIALDSDGNLYVADVGNERVLKVNRSTQSLDFGQTNVGTNLDLSLAIQNIGNTDLLLTSPALIASSPAFSVLPADNCTILQPIATGNVCNYVVQYAPTSIGLSLGSVAITSDNQAIPGTITTIHMIGSSQAAVDHLAIDSQPVNVVAGSLFSYTVRAEDPQGDLVRGYRGTITLAWSSDTAAPASYSFTDADAGSHTFSGSNLTLAGIKSLTVQDTVNPALSVSGNTLVFAGVPVSLTIVSGNDQFGYAYGAFAPLVVSTHDLFGNVSPGATVTFTSPPLQEASATSAPGAITLTGFTDSTGMSFAYLTANGIDGRYPVLATLSNGAMVVFYLFNAPPGVPASGSVTSFSIIATPQITSFDQNGSASSSISANTIDGFSGIISLTCQAPPGFTCKIPNPQLSVSPNGIPTASAVTIQTMTPSPQTATVTASGVFSLVALLGLLPICAFNRSNPRLKYAQCLFLALFAFPVFGCGVSHNAGKSVTTTVPVIPQAMQVTVFAVGRSASANVPTASVTITINPFSSSSTPVPQPRPCQGSRQPCIL